jgi:TonB-dependent starch-binding outer membrane protein SusC
MNTASEYDPMLPVRDPEGNFTLTNIIDLDNPVALAHSSFDQLQTNRTYGNFFAEYQFIRNLSARVRFGSDRQVARRDAYLDKTTKRGQQLNGQATVESQERSDYLVESTLHYNNVFNPNHSLNAVAGYTFQVFNGRGVYARGANFVTDNFITDNLSAGDPANNLINSNRFRNGLVSYLGRVNYSFMDRYLLTVSMRADGSSRFGEGNKFGYFPSAAVAWRISDEPFIAGLNVFSDLKLRGSYGYTGNQEIGNGRSLILISTVVPAIFNGQQHTGMAPIQPSNPNLKWETTRQLDIGMDYGFFNGRVSGSVDYYVKSTNDLLLDLPIPITTGFAVSTQNVGDTRNKGIDFMLDSRNVVGENFNWSTTLNFSTLRNEVTNLGNLPHILRENMRFLTDFIIFKEGHPMGSYYGYIADGVFQSQEEVNASAQPTAKPGDVRFRDISGPNGEPDGLITAHDRTILGDPFPDFSAGFNNRFQYRGVMLEVFFEGNFGHQMLNFTRLDSESPIEERRNRQRYVLDRWTATNPSTTNPSFVTSPRVMSSRIVEDADFIRLRNIMLSYSFPTVNIRGMRSLMIYASAQNVLTFTNYSGNNPDVNALGDSNTVADFAAYPLARTFTLGLNIGL